MNAVKYMQRIAKAALAYGLFLVSLPSHAQITAFNQLGFLPDASKIIVVPNVEAGAFYLVEQSNNHEMLRGPLTQPQAWGAAKQTVKVADFTAFNKPGTYRLHVPGLKDSAPFVIGEGVYNPLVNAVAKSFYFHRAGSALSPQFAGEFARSSAFADLSVNTQLSGSATQSTFASFPKGWVNGSDYGKSVIANAQALAGLFHAYQSAPQFFQNLDLKIPESSNTTPDLLAEAKWALDWLLTMQDSDGGVFHAVATLDSKGFTYSDVKGRFLMPKSTAATLQFAAIMARASSVAASTQSSITSYQKTYAEAAIKAWLWAQKNPKLLYLPPANFYEEPFARADETLTDEWLWAAAELYAVTAKKDYLKAIKLPSTVRDGVWQNVEMWALFSLIENPKSPAELKLKAEQLLNQYAFAITQMQWQSGYMVPLTEADFTENSNGIAAARAMALLKANQYKPNKDYEPAARSLFDYLLGRNSLGKSFVTGFGSYSPKSVYGVLANEKQKTVPGLVVAGPEVGVVENCRYSYAAVANAYQDSGCSLTNRVGVERLGVLLFVFQNLRTDR